MSILFSKDIENIVYGDLFKPWKRIKTRQRVYSIIDAAIYCYDQYGIENTTFKKLAAHINMSRPLILRYFKNYDELFYFSVKFIRVHFQQYAIEAIQKNKTGKDMLSAYIYSTFKWVDEYKKYAGLLLLYFNRCNSKLKDRRLNTQFSQAGATRIASLIQLGIQQKDFNSNINYDVQAKNIQTIIAGALITYATEIHNDKADYQSNIHDLCMNLLK